jgi:hypothetical protein
MSSARDAIRRSAQLLRQDEARYASPALTFSAAPSGAPELAALKQMDALLAIAQVLEDFLPVETAPPVARVLELDR